MRMSDLIPWPGIKPRHAAPGGRSLSHRTAREVPAASAFDLLQWSAVKEDRDQHNVENMLKIEMQEDARKGQAGPAPGCSACKWHMGRTGRNRVSQVICHPCPPRPPSPRELVIWWGLIRFFKMEPGKNALSSVGPLRVGRKCWAMQNLSTKAPAPRESRDKHNSEMYALLF